jgi:hypothetical protein
LEQCSQYCRSDSYWHPLVCGRRAGFKEGACALAAIAERAGIVMSDFLMASTTPSPGRNRPRPGVFVVATMPDPRQRPSLKYYKLGEGPYYVFERPFHLCHFELPKTVRAAVDGDAPLLNNGASPRYGVAAVAKRDLAAGETIARGVGGFDVRGEGMAIAEDPEHAPASGCASTTSRSRRARRSRPGSAPSPGGRADRRPSPGRSAPPEPPRRSRCRQS